MLADVRVLRGMMRKFALMLLFLFCYSCGATTYYISPSGNDSTGAGTSGSPWAGPNHSVFNCGDVLIASAGTYSSFNFQAWGTVTCPGNNNVVWLQCVTFAACSITATSGSAMAINASYWGVQGWVLSATTAAIYGACIKAVPTGSTTIHHIIMANNVANGCQDNGFTSSNNGSTSSVDYLVIIGNIAYNAAQSSTECYSGISINQPANYDSVAGTHIYVAGNFSYANFDSPAASCGGTPTDGEGIIFDTFDNQLGGPSPPYSGQSIAENNMLIGNGGRGMQVVDNNLTPHATIYIRNNTIWNNNRDTNQNATECGELTIQNTSTVIATGNLIATASSTGCGAHPISAMSSISSDNTNTISGNWAYAVNGQNAEVYGGTFTYGTNTLGTSPGFTSAAVPGAPSCGSYSSVPACMASVVANFVPTAIGSTSYGYQTPGASVYDPLFPQWLCNVTIPSGLITMGCSVAPVSNPSSFSYIL